MNSYQQVEISDHFYSVPQQFVGNYVRVDISAFSVQIFDKEERIAEHHRKFAAGKDSLHLSHYLDQLQRKPGAFIHNLSLVEKKLIKSRGIFEVNSYNKFLSFRLESF